MTTDSTGTRQPLSRDRIVSVAMDVVDADGLGGLSMRRVGSAVGVKAMSLYNHVADKDDLIAGLVDAVYGEVALPDVGSGWRVGLRQISVDTRDALLRHPWACEAVYSAMVGPHRIAHMEAMLGLLRNSGFSIEDTHHAFHALNNHVVGHAMQTTAFTYDADDLEELGEQFLASLDQQQFPFLAEHVRYHAEPGSDEASDFVLVLDMILDGLERLRDSGRSA